MQWYGIGCHLFKVFTSTKIPFNLFCISLKILLEMHIFKFILKLHFICVLLTRLLSVCLQAIYGLSLVSLVHTVNILWIYWKWMIYVKNFTCYNMKSAVCEIVQKNALPCFVSPSHGHLHREAAATPTGILRELVDTSSFLWMLLKNYHAISHRTYNQYPQFCKTLANTYGPSTPDLFSGLVLNATYSAIRSFARVNQRHSS